MNGLIDLFRTSYPKNLRFDSSSRELYNRLKWIAQRNKNRRYIDKAEIHFVLEEFMYPPFPAIMQFPIVRNIFLFGIINNIRVLAFKRRSWLLSRGASAEYEKIYDWLQQNNVASKTKQSFPIYRKQGSPSSAISSKIPVEKMERTSKLTRATITTKLSSSSSSSSTTEVAELFNYKSKAREEEAPKRSMNCKLESSNENEGFVQRESFEKEVLANFRVAESFHRVFRFGCWAAVSMLVTLLMWLNDERIHFFYLHYWRKMNREEIMNYFRAVTERHMTAEIPSAYSNLLPAPYVVYRNANNEECYAVNILELTCVEKGITVIAIPTPIIGDRLFYEKIGKVMRVCDGLFLEGVNLENSDCIQPMYLLPLKKPTFNALGVTIRFLDIVQSVENIVKKTTLDTNDEEPPILYPAGFASNWQSYLVNLITPNNIKFVLKPTLACATKGEARIGWGFVREVIDEIAAEHALLVSEANEKKLKTRTQEINADAGTTPLATTVLCLPWTTNQIVNLEASLLKYGFKVQRVFPIHWMGKDFMGHNFCDYFNLEECSDNTS